MCQGDHGALVVVRGHHHIVIGVQDSIHSTRYLVVGRLRVSSQGQGVDVQLLGNLDSVLLSLLIPVRDNVGAEVVVSQGALKGPALPVTAPVGLDLKVPALLNSSLLSLALLVSLDLAASFSLALLVSPL